MQFLKEKEWCMFVKRGEYVEYMDTHVIYIDKNINHYSFSESIV